MVAIAVARSTSRKLSRRLLSGLAPPSKATHPHLPPHHTRYDLPLRFHQSTYSLIAAPHPQAHLASAKTTIVPLDSPISLFGHHICGELTTSLPYSAHTIAKIENVRTFETIDMAFAHFSDRAAADCLADVSRACSGARLRSVRRVNTERVEMERFVGGTIACLTKSP